jgi:hypothetical protein
MLHIYTKLFQSPSISEKVIDQIKSFCVISRVALISISDALKDNSNMILDSSKLALNIQVPVKFHNRKGSYYCVA